MRAIGEKFIKRPAVIFLIALSCSVSACSFASKEELAFRKVQEAYELYWGNNWQKVIDITTEAIKMDPEHPWFYSVRGAAHKNLKQYPQALADLNKAIELSPDFVPALTNRGLTYLEMQRFEEAERDMGDALKFSPDEIIALVGMARLQSVQGKAASACEYMTHAVKNGFDDMKLLEEDEDFADLHEAECFKSIVELYNTLSTIGPEEDEEEPGGPAGGGRPARLPLEEE